MASAKQTAKDPEDLKVAPAVAEVEAKSKVSPRSARLLPNSTFGSRAKGGKRVSSASNKAVKPDETEAK